MGLAQRSRTVAVEATAISSSTSSTSSNSFIRVLPNLQPSQPANDLEITWSPGTNGILNILGIPVTIEIDEDAIVVTDYTIHMYGVGNSIQEAIEDYKISIKAYLEELQEDEDRLSSNLKLHLYYLRDKSRYFE